MFTGIVEETGKVVRNSNNRLVIEADCVLNDTNTGDSIAINGVCLTVVEINKNFFEADVSDETLSVTSIKHLKTGSVVNLERAMPAQGRFGGHIVSGHIDGTGKIISIENENNFHKFIIELDNSTANYVIKKGSITIDGISLTVSKIDRNVIEIDVIPHTYEKTSLNSKHVGDCVNVETDIIAKYVEKFLSMSDNEKEIDMQFLMENGF